MDFDWIDAPFDLKKISPREIEESYEDPFSLRLLPESDATGGESRFFCLGKTVGNLPVFSVFWTDGKKYRVIFARQMTSDELSFYERRNTEFL
jgi:uncharacterized DUF497 family protein